MACTASAQVSFSNNVVMSNTLVAGNAALLINYGFSPTSFRIRSNIELSNYYNGATQNMWQWRTNNGVTNIKNPHCWGASIDLTGLTFIAGSISSRYVSMISPNYGISCAHSPPVVGDVIVFCDINGTFKTNGVTAVTANPTNDIELIQVSNTLPATVHPFHLMPVNWRLSTPFEALTVQDNITGFRECFQCFWMRPQTWNLNVMLFQSSDTTSDSASAFPADNSIITTGWSVPVTEDCASGGDSSGAVFMLVNNVPVLAFTTHNALSGGCPGGIGINGPIVSDSISWIQQNIGSDTLSIVWMGNYTPY